MLVILLVLLLSGTEALLSHNSFYTGGEVMQGVYWLLVAANLPILLVALWRPRIGVWCALGLGALLLPWQASENRKWALIHEEVLAVIRHVEAVKKSGGVYPPTLDGYRYQRPWIREHVAYAAKDGAYRLSWFINDEGISYWYDPGNGFGYYPD